jgi:LAS superfamily LD-carboxypeptidase LdcB
VGAAAPAGRTDAATVARATAPPASTPTIPTEGAARSPVTSPTTPSASTPATSTAAEATRRGRRAAAATPAAGTPAAPRESAAAGRRAAAPGGRRAATAAHRGAHRADGRATLRTPARCVPAVATLATADAPLNRAERRRTRPPRRSATRVAQGAVALGLALGVGGFALTPAGAQRGAVGAATSDETPEAAAGDRSATLAPEVVQERSAAVVLASTTAQQADTAKADAQASAVPADAMTELSTAVAELDTLIAATQAQQPAIAALEPDAALSPVLSGEALASAVAAAGATAQADAAAAAGATTASDELSLEAAPTAAPSAGATPATEDGAVDDPATVRLTAAVERVATLTAELQVVTQQTQEVAAARAAAEAAARKEAQRTSLDAYANGKIPASALCELGFAPGQQLRCDAAEALEQLNAGFAAAFGTNLVITDSYRSYSQQVACRQQKGSLCATPGTSNHGTGTAVDLGGNAYTFGTDQHDWMLAHAEEYGWTLPDWARANGSKPEPWHWEYVG